MTGQLCFPDNTPALTLIPMRLTSWCFALFISCDWPKSITDHRRCVYTDYSCLRAAARLIQSVSNGRDHQLQVTVNVSYIEVQAANVSISRSTVIIHKFAGVIQ